MKGTKILGRHQNHPVITFYHFRNVGSRWALEQAKYNLINEYFLVGVTEELEDFIMLLEAALPRFFRGATELYRTGISSPLNYIMSLCVYAFLFRRKHKGLFGDFHYSVSERITSSVLWLCIKLKMCFTHRIHTQQICKFC